MDFLDNFLIICTAGQIAKITGVSERTAQRWISGQSKPKTAHMRLLLLHDTGRVMPQKWAKNFRFEGETLNTGHKQNLSQAQIDWYFYSLVCWHNLLDLLPKLEARLDALMKVCPPAEVISLQAYKDDIARLKNRPFAIPHDHQPSYDLPAKPLTRAHGC